MDANVTTARAPGAARQLPLVLAVTAVVCVLPAFVAPRLVSDGGIRSVIAVLVLTLALSAGAAQLGAAAWSRRRHKADVLFADLLLGRWLLVQWRERRLRRMRSRVLGEPPSPRPGRLAALARVGLLLEARDRNVYGHSRRVSRYAQGIAHALHLPADEVETIRQAALVHDVGKIYTPREILDKPGRLTDAEFDVIKRHPGEGAELLEASADAEIRAIVRHHHERVDGGGYPDGIAGDEIPIGARIIAVADTFDALASTRSYRPAATHRRALEVLRTESGRQLDAAAVGAFLRIYTARRPVVLTATAGSLATRLTDRAISSVSQAGSLLQTLPAIGAAIAVAGSAAPATARLSHPDRPAAARASVSGPVADPVRRIHPAAATGDRPRRAARPQPTARRGGGSSSERRPSPGATSAPPAPARVPAAQATTNPASAAPSAEAPHSSTPPAATPTVSTPAVTTPQVTTPVVTLPAVTVPSVTVPSVTVPTVTLPKVSVPPVSLPKVALP